MKKAVLFLSILLAIAVCQWQIAESKCCPPPPATTGPVRTLPRSQRTSPPNTDITLPPQTSMPNQTITAPGGTSVPGPITATQQRSGARTTVGQRSSLTTAPTNNRTTGVSGRPTGGTFTPNQTQQTPGGSAPGFSTEIPTASFSGITGGASPVIIEPEFAWEDWWERNVGYLLSSYEGEDEEHYIYTDIVVDDIPRVITLLSYRGLFDRGIHDIVAKNLAGIGAEKVVPVLAKIVQKKFKFNKKNKASNYTARDYSALAIRALGFMHGKKAADAVAAVLLKDMAVQSTYTVADSVDTLLNKSIKDSAEKTRFWACMSLGSLGDEKYIPVLEKVLEGDRSKFVRIASAEAIAMIGGAKASKALNEGFDRSKKYYQVQTFVAASLGYVGASDPIDDILAALKSSNGDVRAAATWALLHVITEKIQQKKPYAKLVKELEVAIKSESDPVICRSKALGFLVSPNSKLIDLYSSFLTYQRDSGVRAYSALALGYTGSPDAVEHLVALKADKDETVEKALAYSMAMLVSGKFAKISKDIFDKNEANDTLLASGVLGISRFMEQDDAYKLVYKLRNHKGADKIVVRAASFAFARFLGEKAFRTAMKNLKTKDSEKSAFSYIGLGIVNTVESLKALDTKAKGKEVPKCVAIARGLMGGLPLVSALKAKISGGKGKSQLRAASLVALGCLNRPEEINTILKSATDDSDYKARAYALAGLINVKIPKEMEDKVVSTLIKIIKDDHQYMVQGYAALMLSKFPDNRAAYEGVRKAINSSNTDLVAMAGIALGMFGNPAAIKDIKNIITRGRGTPLAYSGYIALGMMRDKSNLEKVISDFEFARNPEEFEAMAFAIAMSASKDTYSGLLKYLKNPDVYLREYSVKCLAMMDNLSEEARKEIIDSLKPLEKDEDRQVRFFAGIARYSLGDNTGLKSVLQTVVDKQFYFSTKVGEKYVTLMELINETMPMYFKLKPFFWDDDE